KLYCLQGASRSWEFGYREELERYAGEVPWFKYVTTVSRPWEDLAWKGETGRVDDLLRKYADEWGLRAEETTGYLCGHPVMAENVNLLVRRVDVNLQFPSIRAHPHMLIIIHNFNEVGIRIFF